MWMCESAISCFLLNQASVFHLKHQKCENVISHIKILTVKPSCSCFMHLRVTEMSEDICLWWLAVWDQIKKCCPQLFSVSYWSSAASKNLKKHQIYVCLFEKHWKMKPFLSFWTWSRDKNKHSSWCTSVTEEFSTDVDTGQVLTEWRVSFKSVSSGP